MRSSDASMLVLRLVVLVSPLALGLLVWRKRRDAARVARANAARANLPWLKAMRDQLARRQRDDARPPKLPVELLPHLVYGDRQCAADRARLRELGVTHVLNCAGAAGDVRRDPRQTLDGVSYLSLDADDEEGYPIIRRHLAAARAHIRAAEACGGRCLVHCVAGINRSGVLCAAELMLRARVPVLEAVALCRRARGSAFLWNESFQEQLVALAREEGLLGARPEGYDDAPLAPRGVKPKPAAALAALARL